MLYYWDYAEHWVCRQPLRKSAKGKAAATDYYAVQKQQTDNELFQADKRHQPFKTWNTGRFLSHAPWLFQGRKHLFR